MHVALCTTMWTRLATFCQQICFTNEGVAQWVQTELLKSSMNKFLTCHVVLADQGYECLF